MKTYFWWLSNEILSVCSFLSNFQYSMWINGFWRVSWDFIWINWLTNLSILFRLFWLYTLPLRHVSRPLQGLFCYIYTIYIDHPKGRLNFWIERVILCCWLMLFLTQRFMERLKKMCVSHCLFMSSWTSEYIEFLATIEKEVLWLTSWLPLRFMLRWWPSNFDFCDPLANEIFFTFIFKYFFLMF